MKKLSKYSRRIRMVFGQTAIVASVCMMIFVPWSKGFSHAQENYYTVMIDGQKMGYVEDEGQAQKAYETARMRLEMAWDSPVYVDSEMTVERNNAVIGDFTDGRILENNIYQKLCETQVEAKEAAYTLTVGDVSVVLASLEEISEVINRIKDSYDDAHQYQVVIQEQQERFGTATCELVQASIEPENEPIVMASEGEQASSATAEGGDMMLSFADKISISENHASSAQVMSVEEALTAVGSVLDVISVKQETYTESIAYETEYRYDDAQYSDESVTIQEGQAGQKQITARITYKNGVETAKEVLDEQVTASPVTNIIIVGTKERPTYALPLKNPHISDVFGPRWGTIHRGMDFSCSIGTAVLASASGEVVEAAYRNDFGYTIVIDHGNNTKTRYAHMSELYVQEGSSVSQGDTIGLSGNTGDTTGPHLHFEMIVDGERVDPQPYLYP